VSKKAEPLDLAALAAQYNIKLSDEELALKPVAEVKKEKEAEYRQELEAGTLLLQSLHYKHQPAMIVCKNCDRTFLSNYCREWYCSRQCMVTAFEKRFGVAWDRIKPPASYWENEPAIRVSPDQTDMLYEWCRAFVDQYESTESPQTDQQPEPTAVDILLDSTEDPETTAPTEPQETHNPVDPFGTEDYEAQANLPEWLVDQVDPFA